MDCTQDLVPMMTTLLNTDSQDTRLDSGSTCPGDPNPGTGGGSEGRPTSSKDSRHGAGGKRKHHNRRKQKNAPKEPQATGVDPQATKVDPQARRAEPHVKGATAGSECNPCPDKNKGNPCPDKDKGNRGPDDDEGNGSPAYIWNNVTKNGWVKKCILVEGLRTGGRPRPGDMVLVKSQGKLKDGRIIDDEPSLVFCVGDHEVIEGLDLAVQSMYKNELSIVSVKPEVAYGSQGRVRSMFACGGGGSGGGSGRLPDEDAKAVPADARITYLFGLLHFEKGKEVGSLTWAQRRKSGQAKMRLANWWYQRKEYSVAVKCYKRAMEFYNNIPTDMSSCSTPEEHRELLQLMEERLRIMRQVASVFKRIANLIQSGQIDVSPPALPDPAGP